MDLSRSEVKSWRTHSTAHLPRCSVWPSLIKSDQGSDWTQRSRESLLIRRVIEESGPRGRLQTALINRRAAVSHHSTNCAATLSKHWAILTESRRVFGPASSSKRKTNNISSVFHPANQLHFNSLRRQQPLVRGARVSQCVIPRLDATGCECHASDNSHN